MSVETRWLIKGKITWTRMSLATSIKRQNRGLVWHKLFLDRWLSLCANVFFIFGCFWRFLSCKNVWRINCCRLRWEYCVVLQDTFYPRQDLKKLVSNKKLFSIVAQNWLFQPKIEKICHFNQYFYPLHDFMQRHWMVRVCWRCNFEFFHSLKSDVR